MLRRAAGPTPQSGRLPSRRSWLVPLLLCAVTLASLCRPTCSHQMIAFPRPMSRDPACRVGVGRNCQGPCPNTRLRKDRNKYNPSAVVSRGKVLVVRTLRNNHNGGFSRWALVNVRQRMNRLVHDRNTFLYTCADINAARCRPRDAPRDCQYDKQNLYYRHYVRIPTCVPDGVYVLSWAWYGGGGLRYGHFGDYYDCMYIRVKGGRLTRRYSPRFRAGGRSRVGRLGLCRATVNRLGVCRREPCGGRLGGVRTHLMLPAQFETWKRWRPSALQRRHFAPFRAPRLRRSSARVVSMTIRSSDVPQRVYVRLTQRRRNAHLKLVPANRVTITCEVNNPRVTRHITFYAQGRRLRRDSTWPYSVAGDRRVHNRWFFAPWKHPIKNRVLSISCRAVGHDGLQHWLSVELSTNF